MDRNITRILVFLSILGIAVLCIYFVKDFNDNVRSDSTATQQVLRQNGSMEESSNGQSTQYTNYTAGALKNDFKRHILFFHADWCPECVAFERELLANPIPSDIQILKVDYDKETALKQKYGVTLQTTFVEVNDDGALESKWVGYSEDKSVRTILDGLEGS